MLAAAPSPQNDAGAPPPTSSRVRSPRSPYDERRPPSGAAGGGDGGGRGGRFETYSERDYGRAPSSRDDRDWDEWDRRRADTRGRSRSPGYSGDGRRKRRGSFSPVERDRYDPRPRYEEDRLPRSSRYPDPYEAETPVSLRPFIDWFSSASPEEFAEDERASDAAKVLDSVSGLVGIKARYEKYRKFMIAKQMELMFRYHVKFPWFNEKYNPAPPFVNLRLRVRREGWDNRIDKFIDQLVDGQHDPKPKAAEPEPGSDTAKVSIPSSVPPKPRALDEDVDMTGGDEDKRIRDQVSGDLGEQDYHEASSNPTVDNGNSKANGAGEHLKQKQPENGVLRDSLDLPPARDRDRDPRADDEEVTVEAEENQVLIRTIPPDIGRVRLEKICRNVEGFVHLALGDTMQKRNFYRAGWIKFRSNADMTNVIDRLGDEKIEGFKLHVSHSTRPFSGRARYAPEASLRPERVSKDLAAVKKLVALLEDEAHELLTLPENLPEPRNLPKSKGGDLPDESDKEGDGAQEMEDRTPSDNVKTKPASGSEPMAVDDDRLPPKDRGSVAVEDRLEKLYANLENEVNEAKDADGNALPKDEKALQPKKNLVALDLYLAYLRAAFNCCYYCSAVTDHVEELQRKCIKHERRLPPKNKEPQRDDRWEEQLDQKTALLIDRQNVDPRDHGGKSYEEELAKAIEPHVKQEDEGKFRCKSCTKLFKAMSFVEKHIVTRHSELVQQLDEIPFYNNWALDPHRIQPFTHIPPPNQNGMSAPPEAFGLRQARRDDRPPPRGSYTSGAHIPYAQYSGYAPPPGGYYGGYPPPPPYGYDYYRDPYYSGYPPPPAGYPPLYPLPPPPIRAGGYDRRSPPPRGGRLSDRLGGYANDLPEGLPIRPDAGGGGGRGGRPRRGSVTSDSNGGGGPPPGPPPGAKEDPRAAGGRRSYHDIDRTAEGDVELSY